MPTIHISDFEPEGVTLTPAGAANFDVRAQAILGAKAAPMLELKPFLAIVRNRNPRTVVGYTVAWTATLRNGSSQVDYTQFKFPDAVAGTANGLALLQGREMRNGDERLVGMGFEAWPPEYGESYRDYGLVKAGRLGEVTDLHIALDAVIFEDGAMVGRDESRLAAHFIEFVRAKQSLYRDIVIGLENGGVRDDVFAPLRQTLAARQHAPHQDGMADYRRQAAAEVLGLRDRVLLEIFRRTLRREPFVIRRLSETSD